MYTLGRTFTLRFMLSYVPAVKVASVCQHGGRGLYWSFLPAVKMASVRQHGGWDLYWSFLPAVKMASVRQHGGWGLYWSFRSVKIASVQTQDVEFVFVDMARFHVLLSWCAFMYCVPGDASFLFLFPAGWLSGEWRAGKPSLMGMLDTLGCWIGCCCVLLLRVLRCCF